MLVRTFVRFYSIYYFKFQLIEVYCFFFLKFINFFHYYFAVICAGVFADVWKVHVEPEMKALVSSCVVLPCSFKYPVQEQPSDRIRAMWHMKDNWDDIIFHKDPTRVKDSFKGRTKLIGSLGGSNCSLEIDEVKNHDNGPYCFRVELETSKKDKYSFVENCVSIKMIGK